MTERRFARRQAGLSLIELMIAMLLGLLVAAGIVTVFTSTSSSNRAQTQLARLQEEGRFAVNRISDDLSLANGQYCSNSGGNAHLSSGGQYLDGLRSATVYAAGSVLMTAFADVTTTWGSTSGSSAYPTQPTSQYSLPSFLAMRGYDCTATACTTIDPNSVVASIPATGTSIGKRVIGADVLTLRYLDTSRGWTIYPAGSSTGSTMVTNGDGTLKQVNLAPTTGEPPITDFKTGELAMLANCSGSQIFAAAGQGTATITPAGLGTTNGTNFALPSGQQSMAAPKLFDLNRDFQTVTYYLKVVDNGSNGTTGALIRRVNGGSGNGGSEDELVRGIERLDFKYGVQYPDGTVKFLAAKDLDASTKSTTGCTASVPYPADSTDKGCLWRAVKNIELDLLMDGQVPLYTLTSGELQYSYATDGITAPADPTAASRVVTPTQQGFPLPMIRREFTAMISVRNYNP